MIFSLGASAAWAWVPVGSCRATRTAPIICQVTEAASALAPNFSESWFQQTLDARPATLSADALEELRASAEEVVRSERLPRRKDEAWRRTDLSKLFATSLLPPSGKCDDTSVEAYMEPEQSDGMRLVLVDGVFSSELSDLSALPPEAAVGSFVSLDAALKDRVAATLAELPETGADKRTTLGSYTFAALNQAGFADVACVIIPAGLSVEKPLRIVYLSSAATETPKDETIAAVSHPNLLVCLDAGSELSLLQHYVGAEGEETGAYFTNGLTRIAVGEDCKLTHAYVQEQAASAVHIDSVAVDVAAGGEYLLQAVQSGASIGRLNVGVSLRGRGASARLQGLGLAGGSQLSDFHSYVLHATTDTQSEQEQRNAVSDRARIVFKGAVVVPHGSDNTVANQLCRSLLLSDGARVDVQPTLEIDTDEVECTHGATICDLDDEMVFYLQSRGLDRLESRQLLLEGWARSLMDQVPSAGAKERVTRKAAVLAPELQERAARKNRLSSI